MERWTANACFMHSVIRDLVPRTEPGDAPLRRRETILFLLGSAREEDDPRRRAVYQTALFQYLADVLRADGVVGLCAACAAETSNALVAKAQTIRRDAVEQLSTASPDDADLLARLRRACDDFLWAHAAMGAQQRDADRAGTARVARLVAATTRS